MKINSRFIDDIDHNTLTSIQGGDSVNSEYYHLTGDEYSDVQDVLMASNGYCILKITFAPEFVGTDFTVTDNVETVAGTVSSTAVNKVNVTNLNSVYKISLTYNDSLYMTTVATGSYYGQYPVTLNFSNIKIPDIYGVTWDGTSTTQWARTNSAASFVDPVPYVNDGVMTAAQCSSPFDDIYPWNEMTKVERACGTMVKIPKFWYKLSRYGSTGLSIQITDRAYSGFSVSPAHMNRGDGKGERDLVYVGRYHCAYGTYKSMTGLQPQVSVTRPDFRTNIHNLGTNIWQWDWSTLLTIQLLYLVEYANWDSQGKIGISNGYGLNMGGSDSMPYHTGTMSDSRSTGQVGVQYRNIEDLWSNVMDWIDGCYYSSSGMSIILNPNRFSDTANGTVIGTPSSGLPSAFGVSNSAGFSMIYPTTSKGSNSTFSCDSWYFGSSRPCLFVGGGGTHLNYGLFCVHCNGVSSSGGSIGSRFLELP